MVSQSCLTLLQPCGAMDCDLLGSSVHGISQARRILEWITISSSKGSSQPRNRTRVSLCLLHWQVGALPLAPPSKPMKGHVFCVLFIVSYSCMAEYYRLSCFNKNVCTQSCKLNVWELVWAGCFLLWPVSLVYQWVVPPPSSYSLYSVCVSVLIYSSYRHTSKIGLGLTRKTLF